MQRRAFVQAVLSLSAGVVVAGIPTSALGSVYRLPLKPLLEPAWYWLNQWGIAEVFTESEVRTYVAYGISWANMQLELVGVHQMAELQGDEIVTELDGALLVHWLGTVHWHALTLATFALNMNWGPWVDSLDSSLWGRQEEVQKFGDKAAQLCEAAAEDLLAEAKRRFQTDPMVTA